MSWMSGCGNRKSALLLERQARGPVIEESEIASQLQWALEPVTQTNAQDNVDVSVTYASAQFLQEFFNNKQIFGAYAGLNPFFSEELVFYVKFNNHSGKKIEFNPDEFMIVDDRGNQYQSISSDYTNALAEAKAPMATLTRGVLDEARPGYFGVGLPVGKILAKSQRRFALLKMASLQRGVLHDGVVYDGLVVFWSPHRGAKELKLLVTDIKTDFKADDKAQKALEFAFRFSTSPHPLAQKR
ncbi:MAG: hypothetical protein HYZ92_02465 [Candidatus Omnitrophica bacterium]|nr:hypothetical protein [Candidatus Omnitrophota bacterium]